MLIDKKYGVRIFLFLCIILFLVGGGSPPLTYGVIASLVSTRINKPLNWWRTHLSEERQQVIAKFWPWSIISAVLISLLAVEIAIFGYPFTWFLDFDMMIVILFVIGELSIVLWIFTVITAFVYDIQQRDNTDQSIVK
jgi:hypothetical protein